MKTISVTELAKALKLGTHQLLDVRRPDECAIAAIQGAVNIPIQDLPQRHNELDMTKPIAVLCHFGGRASRATEYLTQVGYDAACIEGGISAWSDQIDSSVPKY